MTTLALKTDLVFERVPAAKLYPGLWLLTLLPVSALVLLDLHAGIFRPSIWAIRFVPALLALLPGAWANLSGSVRATRLRKELRLIAPITLTLLVSTSLAFVCDAPMPLALRFVLLTGPAMGVLVITAAVAIAPWGEEHRLGTLAAQLLSPHSGQLMLEKSALAAYFLVISSLCSVATPFFSPELAALSILSHVLAILTGPAWFFALRSSTAALGMFVMAPVSALLIAPWLLYVDLPPALSVGLALGYGVVMLALTPQLLRAGISRPPPRAVTDGVRLWAPSSVAGPMQVERKLLGSAMAIGVLASVLSVPGYLLANDETREGLFVINALMGLLVCALTPALTLAEPRQLVMQELAAHPRTRVFWRKLSSSLGVAVIAGLVLPSAVMLTLSRLTATGLAVFIVTGLTLWAVSFAVSTWLEPAGTVVATSFGVCGLMVGAQFAALALGAWLLTGGVSWLVTQPAAGLAALGVIGPGSLIFAWRNFVGLRQTRGRDAAVLISVSLVHAATLGVICAALMTRGLMPF